MSLKGNNLEKIGNNGIETSTQEVQEGQESTNKIGKTNKLIAGLVLSALLSGGCSLSSGGKNTLDIEVPKGKDSDKSNPTSEKSTGKAQARKALEDKGIIMPKSGGTKTDPNELVVQINNGTDNGETKGLGNIGEIKKEEEGNPLGLVVNGGAFGTNRRTGGEIGIGNENLLGKAEISDNSKAVSLTVGGETEGGYYGKVTGVVRQEKVSGEYGKTDVKQYAGGGEIGAEAFNNGTDKVTVGVYSTFVTTENKTIGESRREIISGGQRITTSNKEMFKGDNLWTVGGVVSYTNEKVRAQLSAGPTFGDRGPGIGIEGLLEYDLTEFLSLYAKGSSILGRQGYAEGGVGINVSENLKFQAGLYHGEGYQSETGARVGFVYEFGGEEDSKGKGKKTRVITPVAMTDLAYEQTIGKVKKEEKVSIENIMVPISGDLDAWLMGSNINIDLGTIFTGIGTNLEIQSYGVTGGNLVLTGAPTLTGKTLTLNSNGLGFGTASLVIKDKSNGQVYKFDAYNYGV